MIALLVSQPSQTTQDEIQYYQSVNDAALQEPNDKITSLLKRV